MEREELIAELKNVINESLLRIVISNPRIKDGITKIKIRPVMLNGVLSYQSTEYIGTQVFHKNYDEDEIARYVEKMIVNSFKQCEILTRNVTETILVSKKGKITINRKKSDVNSVKIPENIKMDLNHNRKKNYILEEGIPVPFLVDLGVMNNKGEVLKPKYDKFKQINRFLEFIRDVVMELPSDRELKIIDFG